MQATEKKRTVKVRLSSKAFRSIFKSILMIIPVPVVVIIIVELASLFMMERMADDFELQTISRVLNQVDQDFQQANLAMVNMKNDEIISGYTKKSERDYYEETEIFAQLRKIMAGYNIEEIYLYFPEYEYVLSSDNGGRESKLYQSDKYQCSYEEWLEAIDGSWRGKFQTIVGSNGEIKNIVSSNISNFNSQNRAQAVVQLSNTYLRNILSGLSLRGGEEAFVCSQNGMVISTLEGQGDELSVQLLECREKEKTSIRVNDISYKLKFAHSDKTELTLVYATPKGVSYSVLSFAKVFAVTVSILGTIVLIVLAFLAADKNYLPIHYLLNTVRDEDKDLDQNQTMDDLGDLEAYVKKTIHTREEMNRKIKQYEEDMRLLYLGQILFQGGGV